MAEQLNDGWRPSTPAADTLARAYTEQYADLIQKLGQAAGHRTVRTDDFVASDAHQPFPFFNLAVLRRPLTSVDDPVLNAIDEFFTPNDGTPFLVWSATPTPSLASRGWTLMGHPPLMFRPAGPAQVPEPAGVTLRKVSTPAELDTFAQTMVEAYPTPEMAGRPLYGPGIIDAPGWHMWFAELDGDSIGSAAAHVGPHVVDVEWISTHQRCRGRRIGEALTWAATLAEPSKPAMLFASDLGRPVYERMGYVALSRLTLWIGQRAP